jgi:hypothetical protein
MMMNCIFREEGIQLLRDIHSSIYGSHSSWHSIIGKAFKHGFYWTTAKDDAMEIITKYYKVQALGLALSSNSTSTAKSYCDTKY